MSGEELRAAAQDVDDGWHVVDEGRDHVRLRYASDLPQRLNTLRAALRSSAPSTPEPGGLRAALCECFDDERFMTEHLNARSLADAVMADPGVRAALAAPSTPEPSGPRALHDLLWWSEHMQREDRDHIDLADTDEEAERRWQLMQTLGDHERRAAWLRAVIGLPSAAGSSGSGSTSGSDVPSGSLSPASDGRAAPSTEPALDVVERLERAQVAHYEEMEYRLHVCVGGCAANIAKHYARLAESQS